MMTRDKVFGNHRHLLFLILLSLVFILSDCVNQNSLSTTTPTVTEKSNTPVSTDTVWPAPTSTPTKTLVDTFNTQPSINSTQISTYTPQAPIIPSGTIYYMWKDYVQWDSTTSPYVVWGAQLREKMNWKCDGFICDGKDLREYDPNVWHFLGMGEYGSKTFNFSQPLDTFVINYRDRMGFDSLSGETLEGLKVSYGYLTDGEKTASFMDGSNFSVQTILNSEKTMTPFVKPCGIIDPNPNGDKSYNISDGPGGIVWNFLDKPWKECYSTQKGYSLISLTIVSQPIDKITPDQICP